MFFLKPSIFTENIIIQYISNVILLYIVYSDPMLKEVKSLFIEHQDLFSDTKSVVATSKFA